VRVGDAVLVVDVGGGTTDLTLVAVGEAKGELVLERKAVGDHILLGGDNMDLALAHVVRARLAEAGTKLDEWQFRGLVHGCRDAKERLLAADARQKEPVVVLGRSKRVIGGALRTEVTRAEVEATLIDGFFPVTAADERPQVSATARPHRARPRLRRRCGRDAPRGRVLARHRQVAPNGPTAVLFNGGVMKAPALRRRLVDVIAGWYPDGERARVLEGAHLDLAVAEGAATYGLARRGRGVRIRGGTARAYYVGIETAAPAVPGVPASLKALCVAPFGMEEGNEVDLPGADFGLVIGEPAEFRFFGSSVRRDDRAGAIVDGWEAGELEELAPLEATLAAEGEEGRTVPFACVRT
jgi:molecular chaperone DnaK (HSP70)